MERIKVSKKHPGYKDLKWLIKARYHGKDREVLQCICVNANNLVCTDGRRLHILNGERIAGFESGCLYEVLTDKGSEIVLQKVKDMTLDNYPQLLCLVSPCDLVIKTIRAQFYSLMVKI